MTILGMGCSLGLWAAFPCSALQLWGRHRKSQITKPATTIGGTTAILNGALNPKIAAPAGWYFAYSPEAACEGGSGAIATPVEPETAGRQYLLLVKYKKLKKMAITICSTSKPERYGYERYTGSLAGWRRGRAAVSAHARPRQACRHLRRHLPHHRRHAFQLRQLRPAPGLHPHPVQGACR